MIARVFYSCDTYYIVFFDDKKVIEGHTIYPEQLLELTIGNSIEKVDVYEEKDEDMYSGCITLQDFISNSTSLYSLKGE